MKKIRKALASVIRLAIGLAIIVYLLHKIDTGSIVSVFFESLSRWPWLAMAAAMSLVCLIAGTARWKLILEAQNLEMTWGRTFAIYFIGYFFNCFMFGSTGGDIARAYYAMRETRHKKTEAVSTIIIDRVIGMIVLFMIAGAMLAIRFDFYLANPVTHIPSILMLIMIVATIIGITAMFNVGRLRNNRLILRMFSMPRIGALINRVASAFILYSRKTSTLLATTLLSIINQVFIVFMCCCLGRSLDVYIGILDYFTVIPMIMSMSAIPITPGGLGIREGLSVALLGAMDVNSAHALSMSLMVYALTLLWSLIGGLIFVGYSASSGLSLREEMSNIREEAARENGKTGVPGPHE